MAMNQERYDRSQRLFGAEGQEKISRTRVVIAGVSGLGSPLAQQIALLGPERVTLIEPEDLDETNRNRFVAQRASDPVPGSSKVSLAARMIRDLNPNVAVDEIYGSIVGGTSFAAVRDGHYIFGCFDHDGPRFVLNEVCAAYQKPFFDLASDVPEPGVYGGRVCIAGIGNGCLCCRGILDMKAVGEWLSSPEDRAVQDAIYGIGRENLKDKGPSVAPLNGVIANLAALEFMVAVTGLRAPRALLNYYGHLAKLTEGSRPDRRYCPFCDGMRKGGDNGDIERYLKIPHLIDGSQSHHPGSVEASA